MPRVLIWDIPTRLFHWSLASSFALAWLTSEGDRWRSIHVFLGYLILALVCFRVVWGFAGSHFSRFSSFWFTPGQAFSYLKEVLRGHAPRHVGHNPTGSLAIYILLALALGVGITGILTLGGDEQHGLAAGLFNFEQIQWVKQLHNIGATLMLLVVAGHVTGVVVESVLHKENLARSMVNGFKLAPPGTPTSRTHWQLGLVMLIAMLGFGGGWFYYAIDRHLDAQSVHQASDTEVDAEPHVKFVGKALADNAQWHEECDACHVAFYPALLPARSWQKIIADQARHFGENDLELSVATQAVLLKFMVDNAADQHKTEAGFKIDKSIPPSQTPTRVTETPYWVNKHRDVPDAVWKTAAVRRKSNCAACHMDARQGTFEDAAMHLPKAAAPAKTAPSSGN